ncbi:uncharacterized protein LOC131876596 [Cryptomeria japonica]|uniref:uncharacterized protein LOC131876596 n=1 Tax=Cryptomeria japonica TaxID=3369 RepID=UPI0027DA4DB7|nr:uncharacterized protein LOC131876596 [Cryptomeria japonica]
MREDLNGRNEPNRVQVVETQRWKDGRNKEREEKDNLSCGNGLLSNALSPSVTENVCDDAHFTPTDIAKDFMGMRSHKALTSTSNLQHRPLGDESTPCWDESEERQEDGRRNGDGGNDVNWINTNRGNHVGNNGYGSNQNNGHNRGNNGNYGSGNGGGRNSNNGNHNGNNNGSGNNGNNGNYGNNGGFNRGIMNNQRNHHVDRAYEVIDRKLVDVYNLFQDTSRTHYDPEGYIHTSRKRQELGDYFHQEDEFEDMYKNKEVEELAEVMETLEKELEMRRQRIENMEGDLSQSDSGENEVVSKLHAPGKEKEPEAQDKILIVVNPKTYERMT